MSKNNNICIPCLFFLSYCAKNVLMPLYDLYSNTYLSGKSKHSISHSLIGSNDFQHICLYNFTFFQCES